MPQVHIVSRSYPSPYSNDLIVNQGRFYGGSAESAVALMQAQAAPFEHVELAWSEEITEEEFRSVNELIRATTVLDA